MKINSASIDWYKDFANFPQLVVHVDLMTPHNELTYQRKVWRWNEDKTIAHEQSLWAQDGDFCTFQFWGPGDTNGYGGRVFTYKLEDGTVLSLKGPWSSNSLSMNKDFPPCCEVRIFEDEGQFKNLGYHGWNLRYPKFKEVVEGLGAEVAYVTEYSDRAEITFEEAQALNFKCGFAIKHKGYSLKDSQIFKQGRLKTNAV